MRDRRLGGIWRVEIEDKEGYGGESWETIRETEKTRRDIEG